LRTTADAQTPTAGCWKPDSERKTKVGGRKHDDGKTIVGVRRRNGGERKTDD
jgi:hypothetical protein